MEEAMSKLIVSSLVSLDGVNEDPRTWASAYFDDEATEKSLARLAGADAMLMGRKTYEYFAAAWPAASGAYPDRINAIRKYVFSATLATAEWNNTKVVSGDVPAAVAELKATSHGDLVVYGYGEFGQTLLEHDLIDELNLWINPVVLGSGTPLFRPGKTKALQLVSVEGRPNGVVSLSYTKAGA
jgi:dihydrofolate reductase